MKKSTVILSLLAVLVLLVLGYFFYKKRYANPVSGLKPRVEVGVGKIDNITEKSVDLTLNLLVHNPLPVGLDLKGFDYLIKMNDIVVIEDRYQQPFKIESRDSSKVEIPAKFNLGDLSKESVAEANKGVDSADYHFEAKLLLAKPVLGKDMIRVVRNARLPLYRVLQIKVSGYDMEKFRLSESEIVLKIQIDNQNVFPIEFKDPYFMIDLGSQANLGEGHKPGTTVIPAKSKATYELPFKIEMGKLLKAVGQLIGQGKDLPFTLHIKSTLTSENEVFSNSPMNLIIEGELKDMEKLKKSIAN
ncbi:LEA type 2 family protein [Dyadobacter tibetensis]|uniref:LEA type 2 family protein n=1 Tax=Dyadobacter tibetensis TaxID=1211851 RepID=UPI00046F690E|nr:LEA type 2 family protein [Dyadobacter tibetensis]